MLEFIKTDKCPKCGCNIIKEENIEIDRFDKNKYRQHCNGGRWETRTFACGCKIEYIPNFYAEEVKGECINSEEYIRRETERQKFKKAVIDFINNYKETNDYDRKVMLNRMDFSIWW